jgi:acetyl-CoA acyltransferase
VQRSLVLSQWLTSVAGQLLVASQMKWVSVQYSPIPKLLKSAGLSMSDIDLVELNEAFASQCLYSRDNLEIDPEIYNVNGGSISIGHPFGMTGSRLTGHIVRELKRREKKYGIVSMCIGGGMGAAGLFEAC